MAKIISYISPSSFYYWEKCPLKAVYSSKYRGQEFFPKHPDADLGSIIHQFYEKRNEWRINKPAMFFKKWEEKINNINKDYQNNDLQKRFFPIQWHANFYTVKKFLLLKYLLSKKDFIPSKTNLFFEKWISDEVVGGYVDLMIYEGEDIRQITDFKTGSIYERINDGSEIKEVYRLQLALYASVVLNKQQFIPDLFIETIDGVKHLIELSVTYIEAVKLRAMQLKVFINTAINNDNILSLAKPHAENCKYCDYRIICQAYTQNLINKKMEHNIDIQGKVLSSDISEIMVKINATTSFIIKNIVSDNKIEKGINISIFNLYYPEPEQSILYCTDRTIIKHE